MDETEQEKITATAYEESIRALQSQESQLDGLYTRASFILAAAGIATGTVLGGHAGNLSISGLISVIAFGTAAVLSICILIPRVVGWRFTSNAQTILAASAEYAELSTATQVRDWLAKTNQRNYEDNKARLDRLYQMLIIGCGALIVAIAAAIFNLKS